MKKKGRGGHEEKERDIGGADCLAWGKEGGEWRRTSKAKTNLNKPTKKKRGRTDSNERKELKIKKS